MYNAKTVGAVVPAYNEEGYVGDVIDGLSDIIDRAYIVDDGSTDSTWSEIQDHAGSKNAEHDGLFEQQVVPIRHEVNEGVGGAIKTGYLHAREERIDMTAVIAGDGQMDPALLSQFLDPVANGSADYVKGNRFIHSDGCASMPRFRRLGNFLLSYLTKIASGYWTSMDSQNGYTVISLEALDEIAIQDLYEYYGYCNELLVRLNVHGFRVVDVPHSAQELYEEDWKSHIDYSGYIPRVSLMLLRSFLWRLTRQFRSGDGRAIPVAYFTGIAFLIVGILLIPLWADSNTIGGLLAAGWGILLMIAAMALDRRENRTLHSTVEPSPSPRKVEADSVPRRDEATVKGTR